MRQTREHHGVNCLKPTLKRSINVLFNKGCGISHKSTRFRWVLFYLVLYLLYARVLDEFIWFIDCPACRTTLIATRFWVVMICPIIKRLTVLRVFFYFVWFVFIHHKFQFYFKLCTYCNILNIYLSQNLNFVNYLLFYMKLLNYSFFNMFGSVLECCELTGVSLLWPWLIKWK